MPIPKYKDRFPFHKAPPESQPSQAEIIGKEETSITVTDIEFAFRSGAILMLVVHPTDTFDQTDTLITHVNEKGEHLTVMKDALSYMSMRTRTVKSPAKLMAPTPQLIQ
jgi:hypothetical protein